MPNTNSKPQTRTHPQDGSLLIHIPGGEFIMGSNAFSVERPPHRVRVSAFWMARTEVTNAQYRKFTEKTKHRASEYATDVLHNSDSQPVVGVSWDDAVAYCRWAGGRLPSEAEWEFAARGGDGRKYPWGNSKPKRGRAVYGLVFGKGGKAAAVGTTPGDVSPFGILDMAGNVTEWCADWYGPYQSDAGEPLLNPTGPPQGTRRIMRGGCWTYQSQALRATERWLAVPKQRVRHSGFRLVVDIDDARDS